MSFIYPPIAPGQTQYTNVLLISNTVNSYIQFVNSANENTFPIVYSTSSSKTDLLELLQTNFTSISRLCFVFESSAYNVNLFLDSTPLFLNEEYTPYSENTQFIIDIIQRFQIQNIDYLACDTLNYPNWVNYYDILAQNTGVIVGASNNKTGNINYGGDWVLESTREDVELTYFTSQIEYYQYLLDNSVKINGLKYRLDDRDFTATVIQTTAKNCITVPGSVYYNSNTYTVTSIGVGAFLCCTDLFVIHLPNTLTSICDDAFSGCTSLLIINDMPSSVTSIGRGAFYNCSSLKSVSIPSSVSVISEYLFSGCEKLESVNVPNTVTTIGQAAFYNCIRLGNVWLPSTVSTIGSGAFYGCKSLSSITIPDSVTSINQDTFNQCSGLINAMIGDSVSNIGLAAFNHCTSLINVTLGQSVSSIETNAFENCPNLGSVYFYQSVLPSMESNTIRSTAAVAYMLNTVPADQQSILINAGFQSVKLVNISGRPSSPVNVTTTVTPFNVNVCWDPPVNGSPVVSYMITSNPPKYSSTVNGSQTTKNF